MNIPPLNPAALRFAGHQNDSGRPHTHNPDHDRIRRDAVRRVVQQPKATLEQKQAASVALSAVLKAVGIDLPVSPGSGNSLRILVNTQRQAQELPGQIEAAKVAGIKRDKHSDTLYYRRHNGIPRPGLTLLFLNQFNRVKPL
jgi:hypothetical protein